MNEYKIEKNTSEMPTQLNSTFIRPYGINSVRHKKSDLPVSNTKIFQPGTTAIFEINSVDFLDPFSLFFSFSVRNLSDSFLQLDGSASSIIKKIEVKYKRSGEVLEVIDDYNILMSIYNDLTMTQKEREQRREFEGFGDNEYGSNEIVLFPEIYNRTNLTEILKSNVGTVESTILSRKMLPEVLKEPLYQPYDIEMNNINKWDKVYNGKIQPFEYETKDYEKMKNRHFFRIPLMLKTIGNGIQRDNFKFIPMEVLGELTIEITFFKHAFFIPVPITKAAYLQNNMDEIKRYYNQNGQIAFEIEEPRLEYEIYELEPSVRNNIMEQVRSNKYVFDYKGLAYLNQYYVFHYPTIDASTVFRDKTEIRALYFCFLSNLYQKTQFSRMLARQNKGIKKIVFQYKNGQVPKVEEEHNSLCSFGQKNSFYFFNELRECMCNPESVITLKSFTLNLSLNEVFALNNYSETINKQFDLNETVKFTETDWTKLYNRKSLAKLLLNYTSDELNPNLNKPIIEDYNGLIDQPLCKTLYCINFDNMPYSNQNYRNGLKVAKDDKFKLSITRIQDFLKYDHYYKYDDVYTFMYIFVEYYETLVLQANGKFLHVS